MATKTTVVIILICCGINGALSQMNYNASYEWRPGAWTGCAYRDSRECCSCFRKRVVYCALRDGGKEIAPFYCRKLPVPQPPEREKCQNCQQDCVLSIWGEWSGCSETCTPSTRFRTRNVLLLPSSDGDECGALLDIENCVDLPHCDFVSPVSKYSWKIGDWTGCRKNSTGSGSCGPGVREREVYCVNKRSRAIADDFCLQYMPGQQKPKALLMCQIPCPCTVSQWSSWSDCSHSCITSTPSWLENAMGTAHMDTGIQTRSREVVERGDEHAVNCPHLAEKRRCRDGPPCPRYIWKTSDWGECEVADRSEATCGSGDQMRDVTCVEERDFSQSAVSDSYCRHERYPYQPWDKLKPPIRRACLVSCPVHCELGEWESWSVCSQSCGQIGQQIRRRAVVQEASHGGDACGERYETQPCPPSPCVWWNIGKWSTCFLADYRDSCGAGSQVRNVWCVSSLGEVLQDANCTLTTSKPDIEKPCKIPCPEECVISEWGQWSPCNQSCGYPGGMQTRSRRILSNEGETPCLNDSALNDEQWCNRMDCDVTTWIVSAWSECAANNEHAKSCGQLGSGLQTRQIFCQIEGETVNNSQCDASRKPTESRECIVNCPRDCLVSDWSEWTTCDAPCGQSQKHRYRRVESVALNGGRACVDANPDGIILQSKECKRSQDCEWYAWNVTSWSNCLSKLRCGHGVQQRQVYCVRYDGMLTEDVTCLDKVLGSPPPRDRACYKHCGADCQLTEWSEWSQCSETCGRSGERMRTRHLTHPASGLTEEEQCPELTRDDVIEVTGCREEECSIYSWDIGPWTDCIADSPSACGPGIQKRHVFCRSTEGQYTSHEKCSIVVPMPDRYQSCEVQCQIDCVVGNWGAWGSCSQPCGLGLQTRERLVIVNPYNGGAECPPLLQARSCSVRPCDEFMWTVGKWSDCDPNYRLPCGRGERSRAVTCPAGPNFIGECERRQPKPLATESCFLPCPGDCKLTEWSDWSQCDCSTHNAMQSRIRDVIDDARESGRSCENLTDERQCECPQYRLDLGEWSQCIANSTNECGPGTREREVQCRRPTDGATMPLTLCASGLVTSSEACEAPCPRHCELTEFTEWSDCSASCGMDALRIRERRISRRHNRHGGRKCPERSSLTQIETCDTKACFSYTWEEREWSACSIDVSQRCGVGKQTRKTVCVRNDGFEVDKIFCGDHEEDLKQEAPCGEPCPGDCVLSQWSEWGPCYADCKDSQGRGYEVRSRTAIAPAEGGKPCPDDWVEKRPCRKDDAECPSFFWKVRDWDYYDRRRVYCSPAHEDIKVFGGCQEDERPAKKLECSPKCGIYANCLEGTCSCQSGFKGDGQTCLPEYGCHSNIHCIANYSHCDPISKECLCEDDTLPSHDMLCPIGPQKSREEEPKLSDMLIYILIGCFAAIIVIAIIVAAFVISRIKGRSKERRNSEQPPVLSKIDNLETMSKNNENHAKALNFHEIPDHGPAYRTYKSDNAEVPSDFRLANLSLQKEVVSMPTYYSKPQNYSQSHEARVTHGPNDAPKSYHGSNVSGLNQSHADVPVARLRSGSALPYITIPTRNTPTLQEPCLTSFKPLDLDEPRLETSTSFPYPVDPVKDELPQISVSTQSPPGTYPLTEGVVTNGHLHLQTPDMIQRDARRNSPRHQRYTDAPYTRRITGSPNPKAMAPLPENIPFPGAKSYPYAVPNSTNHRPSFKEATNRKSPCIEPMDYQRKQAYKGGSDATPQSPKSRKQPFSQIGKYNSLPRHGASALNDRDIQSDVEYSEPVQSSTVQNYPKYGSLPTKGRQRALKSDAAQNLLEYCDALLADLEKAAVS